MLQTSDMMMKTVLPEDQDSTEWVDYHNMQLLDRMEQK